MSSGPTRSLIILLLLLLLKHRLLTVTLSVQKLRAVINMLSDAPSAAAAAHILAKEARERGLLVSDLIATALAPAPSVRPPEPSAPSTAPPTAPNWRDVEPIDDGGPYVKRLGGATIGLVGEVLAETDMAWLVETPDAEPAWLPKSRVENHGEDPFGRAILILPLWLGRRLGLRVAS
jgi:hypothetical protein